MSTLTRLALLDGELLRLGKRKGELETEVLKIRKQLGAEEARYLKLSGELLSVRTKVESASRQLEEERAQFSERQKRIHSGVGGQTLKSLEGENDRSMIVMDAAEKELGKLKQELSEIESETKSAEALLTERKVALTRQEHEILNQIENVNQSINALELKAGEIRPQLDAELVPHYDKLRKRYADPVAEVEDKTCSGCSSSLPLRIVNSVLGGAIVECPECGRFLVQTLAVPGVETGELI